MNGQILIVALILQPVLAGAAVYGAGRRNARVADAGEIAASSLSLALALLLALRYPDAVLRLPWFGRLCLRFEAGGFRAIYACAAAFAWTATSAFSPAYFAGSPNRARYRLFHLLTLGAATGLFLSADLASTFVCFEAMSLSSYVLVAQDESPGARRAAETYLAVSIAGGLAILMGALLLQSRAGTLDYAELYAACAAPPGKSPYYLPGALLLAGFGAKAGLFPLHFWLPKAHPVAPAPASALLSGILTKTGVFGAAAVCVNLFPDDRFWGAALLLLAGAGMLWGAVLALFSSDLKRILACSSVSQIGFIMGGVATACILGSHDALAVRGALLHMLNHSLIKLLLFTAAGLVYVNLHTLDLDGVRGFGRGKPLFLFVFLMGALSLCGFPLWSGYVSKTLLHESIVEGIHLYGGRPLGTLLRLYEAAFLLTGGLTAAYVAKLSAALFGAPAKAAAKAAPAKTRPPYIARPLAVLLALSAVLLPAAGCFPAVLDRLADCGQGFFRGHPPEHAVLYFSRDNLKGAAISLAIGAALYFLAVRPGLTGAGGRQAKKKALFRPEGLDLEDMLYRPALRLAMDNLTRAARLAGALPEAAAGLLIRGAYAVSRAVAMLPDLSASALIRGMAVIFRIAASLPDVLLWLVMRTALRTSARPYAPGKFLSRHYQAFVAGFPQPEEARGPAGGFTFGLLLTGAGICFALLYVFLTALARSNTRAF